VFPGQLQLFAEAVAVQPRVAQHAGGPDAREETLKCGRLVATRRRLSQRPHGLMFGRAVPGRQAVQRIARLAPPQPLQPLAHFPAPSDQLYNDKNKIKTRIYSSNNSIIIYQIVVSGRPKTTFLLYSSYIYYTISVEIFYDFRGWG